MLANLMIGLREGIEAALIVGILVATLKKQSRDREIKTVLTGVGVAVIVSVLAGVLIATLVADAEEGISQVVGAGASLLAVGFVTWMIFWMSRNARHIGGELNQKLTASKTSYAVAAIGFFAVLREGVETSIFLWTSTKQLGHSSIDLLGAVVGLLIAALAGYALYRGSLKINLALFFKFTGGYLIILAAGILTSAVHELEELHWFSILQSNTYDFSAALSEDTPVGFALKSLFGFNAAPTMLQTLAWVLYCAPICYLFFKEQSAKKA